MHLVDALISPAVGGAMCADTALEKIQQSSSIFPKYAFREGADTSVSQEGQTSIAEL